ncbi:phage tail length tape measure family protein [Acidovorax sp.]|uniref:phage tail length tape measure family protein n=1 Tax=Acidovorax sp. TaxID=1872122 RepID=UPI002ACEB2AB|nr:phage tail length tape measure family protein [Acidovorax sp.]MDZ7863016.1 phage tail length tape measure family protein [Acidovorax sp.]
MAIDQTADAVQANAQYLAQGQAMVSVAQQIKQAVAGQLAVFGSMQQAVSDLSSAMQSLPGQLGDFSSALQSGSASGVDFLERTNQVVGSLADLGDAVDLVMSAKPIAEFSTKLGAAIGGVGTAVAGTFAVAVAAVVAGVAGLAVAYNEGSKESDAFLKALVLSGNEVGATVGQMHAMAASIKEVVGTHGKAAESLAIFASQGATGAATLEQYTQAAIGFERAAGQAVSETAKQFASLQGDPLSAVLKLNNGMNFLTESTYAQIKSLEEQGLVAEAADVAQAAFANALTQRSKVIEQNLGVVERGWRDIKDAVSEALDAVKSVGRSVGVEGQYAAQQQVVDKLQADLASRQAMGLNTTYLESHLNAATDRLADLNNQVALNQINAQLEAERATRVKARAEVEKDSLQYLSDAEKIQRRIKAENEKIKSAYTGLNDEDAQKRMNLEMAERERAILASAARPKIARPSSGKELSEYDKLMKHLEDMPVKAAAAKAAQTSYTKSEAEFLALKASATWKTFSEREQKDIETKYEAVIAAERQTKANQDALQSREKYLASLSSGIEKTKAEVVAQEEANTRMGMSKEAIAALEISKLEMMAVDLELQAIKAMDKNLDEAAYALLIQQAQGYRALAQAKKDGAAKEQTQAADAQAKDSQGKAVAKAEEAAKKAQEQWKATAEIINKSLTDVFMKGLESGKDFGKNLGNALKEQFKNLVLKPTISAMVSPISGALSTLVSGIMGGGNSPLAALGGGSGSGSLLGNLMTVGQIGYQTYTGQGVMGSVGNAISGWLGGSAVTPAGMAGPIASKAALDGTASFGVNSQLGNTLGGAGASGMGFMGYAAIMAVLANAMGFFRSKSIVGSGLKGTLGGATLTPWEEERTGGTLFYGADFETSDPLARYRELKRRDQEAIARFKAEGAVNGTSAIYNGQAYDSTLAASSILNFGTYDEDMERMIGLVQAQSDGIQKGYSEFRKNLVGMANDLGLAGDKIADFTFDLSQQDLNFQGLDDAKIQEKITAAFGKAGASMAKEVLGQWITETVDVVKSTQLSQLTESSDALYDVKVEQVTRKRYEPSEYAKAGETAFDTLTRLATSFNTLNEASDALGFGIHQGSLALADFADDFIEAFGGLERFTASTGAFLQNYYSDEERRQYLASSGSRRLEKLGINVSAEQLLGATGSDIRNAVNSVVSNPDLYGDVMDIANYLAPLYQGAAQAAPAVENLTNAVDELTQKFTGAKEALLNDAKSLSVELLKAQGKEGQAKALERENYLAGFSDLDEVRRQEIATQYDANTATRRAIDVQNERNGLQDELNALTDDATQALTRQRDALDGSNRALFDNVQAVKLQKLLAEELPGVVDKYLSPAQRRQSQYDRVTADLNAAGLKVSTDQLMGLSKAQIGAAAVEIYNLAGVSDEARLAIVRAAGALADLKDADVDSAFAALERAVDAQRTVLSEAITELTTVFETARDAAKSLFGEVESAVQYQGDEGRAFISNALRVATSTGYLPDSEKFTEAVSNATGALGQQMFATQAESDYQRLVLANELKGLQDISGDQLEKAKTQLETLEEQLKVQRQQVEALGGIDASVLSVEQAIDRLATAMNGAQATPRTPTTTLKGAGGASYDLTTGTGQTSSGVAFSGSAIKEAALKAISEGASPQQIYNIIRDSGFTVAQAEQMAGSAPGSLQKLEAEMGWAAAYGGGTGNYSRQSAHSASALVEPTAYDPTAGGNANQQIVSALQDVRAELIEVRKQNDQLQYAATRTADAVNGRPEAPMLVENV